jgi:hypothetical protein
VSTLRRALAIGPLFAVLAVAIATPIPGRAAAPASDFVVLKCDDVTSSSVRLTIIVVDAISDAAEVLGKLDSGASFEALARDYSRHPSAADGGDLGVFPIAELPTEFRTAIAGIKPGGHTQSFTLQKRTVPEGWPENLPVPGDSVKNVERTLGHSYLAASLAADAGSMMTELSYPFGVRLRVHERRGVGFMEFTAPWKFSIFGIRPDDQLPASVLDLFPRTGRFVRGVFVAVPQHPNWFVDVDDRVDAVSRMLFVDRNIYGNLPDIPKSQ